MRAHEGGFGLIVDWYSLSDGEKGGKGYVRRDEHAERRVVCFDINAILIKEGQRCSRQLCCKMLEVQENDLKESWFRRVQLFLCL